MNNNLKIHKLKKNNMKKINFAVLVFLASLFLIPSTQAVGDITVIQDAPVIYEPPTNNRHNYNMGTRIYTQIGNSAGSPGRFEGYYIKFYDNSGINVTVPFDNIILYLYAYGNQNINTSCIFSVYGVENETWSEGNQAFADCSDPETCAHGITGNITRRPEVNGTPFYSKYAEIDIPKYVSFNLTKWFNTMHGHQNISVFINMSTFCGFDSFITYATRDNATVAPYVDLNPEPEHIADIVISDEVTFPKVPRFVNASADLISLLANITTTGAGIYVANFTLVAPNGSVIFSLNGTQYVNQFTAPQTHKISSSGVYTWWINATDVWGQNRSTGTSNKINISFGTVNSKTILSNPNAFFLNNNDSANTNISVFHTGNSVSVVEFTLGENLTDLNEINVSINQLSVTVENSSVVNTTQITVYVSDSAIDGRHTGYLFWNRTSKDINGDDEVSHGSVLITTYVNYAYFPFEYYNLNNALLNRDWDSSHSETNCDVLLNSTCGINGSACVISSDGNSGGTMKMKMSNITNMDYFEAWVRFFSNQTMNLDICEATSPPSDRCFATILINDTLFIKYTNYSCVDGSTTNQPPLQKYSAGEWVGLRIEYHNDTQTMDYWINNGSVEGWREVVTGVCFSDDNVTANQMWFESGGSQTGVTYIDNVNISFYSAGGAVIEDPDINTEFTTPVSPRHNETVSLKANITDPNEHGITDALFTLLYPNGTAVFSVVNGTQSGDIFTSQSYKICGNGSYLWYLNATNLDGNNANSASYNEINITFGTMSVLSPDSDTNYSVAINAGNHDIFNITSSHTGNSNSTIEFFLSENITNSTGVNTSLSATSLIIENGSSEIIEVNVSSAYNTSEGNYVGYLFWNRTTYNESCNEVVDSGSVEFSITVAQYLGDINITVETFNIEKLPDETYIYVWHLQNDGNYKAGDCVMSFISSLEPEVSFNQTNFTLGIGGTASISMVLDGGATDIDDSAVVSITCSDISNTTTGTDTDTATGIFSNVGGSPGSTGGSGGITTHEIPEFKELIVSPGTIRIDAVKSEKKIVIKNDGTDDMNILLSASDSIKSVVSFEDESFLLRPDEVKEVSVFFSPSNLNYDGLIIVQSEGVGEKYVSVQINQIEQEESLLMVLYDKLAEPFFTIPKWDIPIPKFIAGLALSILALGIFFVKTPPRRRTTERKILMTILIIAIMLIIPFLLPTVGL